MDDTDVERDDAELGDIGATPHVFKPPVEDCPDWYPGAPLRGGCAYRDGGTANCNDSSDDVVDSESVSSKPVATV